MPSHVKITGSSLIVIPECGLENKIVYLRLQENGNMLVNFRPFVCSLSYFYISRYIHNVWGEMVVGVCNM